MITPAPPYQVHAKTVLKDVEGAVPDEAPMMIWDDEIELGWSSDEIEGLREMGGFEARHYILTMVYYGFEACHYILTMVCYGLLWFTMASGRGHSKYTVASRLTTYCLPPTTSTG